MRDTVIEVLSNHFGKDKSFDDGINLIDDLGADEFDIVDISITLDEKLNISLDEEAILEVKTVGDLIQLVESNVQSN